MNPGEMAASLPAEVGLGFVEVDGIWTRYLNAGSGPVNVLLLHPGTLVAEVWLPLIKRIGSDVRVYAPDLLGHGLTPYPGRTPTTPTRALARHALAFADAVGLTRFVLIGSSLGAHTSLLTYMTQPERVTALGLFASFVSFAPEQEVLALYRRAADRRQRPGPDVETDVQDHAAFSASREFLRHTYLAQVDVECEDVIVAALATSYAHPIVAASSRELFTHLADPAAVRDARVAHRLGEIAVPVSLIWGVQDSGCPIGLAEPAARAIEGCELTIVEDCGHCPYLEHPDLIESKIRNLIDRRQT